MALTPFDMEGVNRDLLAAGNPAKPDMQSILRRNARDLVLGNAILVSSVDAKELEFGVHMAYSDADGGFDTDPSEDVWFEASSLPIPNERPDLPPDNALRIRVTDVLTEYGFTDIDVKAPDRTPEGIWIGFEAMQPVRLDVTSAQEGRSVSFTLTAAEANDWRSGRLDAHGLSRMAVERVLARPGDTVTLAYGDSLFRPAVMCDGSGRLPEHRVKAGIGTFVIGRESEAVMPEILRIDRTVDPRDPLVIEKAFGKENDMENGNVPEYWKGLMDEADLPLAGIVREHGGGLMDFHRMKGIERLTGSSDWDFYSWTVENYDDDLLDVCERENAAGCSDDLVHGHGQSHVGAGGGFHGVAHFVLHEADVTHGGGDVGVPQHTADKHDVAAVPVVDACGEPTAQAVRRVSGYRLDPLRHVIDAAVSLHVSGEQPYAGAFPQCRSELCRHGKHPLLVALAVDVEHHALGVLLQIGLQVDSGHFDAAQAAERAQHDGQPRVLVG